MKRSPLKRKTLLKTRRGLKKQCTLSNKFQNSKVEQTPMCIVSRLGQQSPKIKKIDGKKDKSYLRSTDIPQKTKDFVLERSNGVCEIPNCSLTDFRGYCYVHIEHRKVGGRKGKMAELINDPRNVVRGCFAHHDIIDNRVKSSGRMREFIMDIFKKKSNWDSWDKETKDLGLR